MGTAGVEDPAGALAGVLAKRPMAIVAAMGPDGLFVPLPASIPADGRARIEARAATDIIEPGEREALIEAWEDVLAHGYGCVDVSLPGVAAPATVHLFDVRDEHGVYAMVLDAGDDPPPIGPVPVPTTVGPAKVVRVRKDGVAVLRWVDRSVTEVLGWDPEELVGRRSLDLIHPDDHELAITAWMEMLAEPGATTRARLRHQRADGGWTWVDISNHNRLDGTAGSIDCEMVDVTTEVEALDALRSRERLLRRLTETMPVGVFHIDVDQQLQLTNAALHEILGTPTDADLDTLVSLAVDPAVIERSLQAALAGSDIDIEVDARFRTTGELRHLLISGRPLFDDDGRVTGVVGCVNDVTDSVRLRRELSRRASVDELTGCLNRVSVLEVLDQVLRRGGDVAVVYVDMDRFKSINDGVGHAGGDAVLRAVGHRLRGAVREHDAVGRMGGDEFLAVCAGLGSAEGAEELRGRIADALGDPVGHGGRRIDIAASVGVAWSPAGERVAAEVLVARADQAMYDLKHRRDEGR